MSTQVDALVDVMEVNSLIEAGERKFVEIEERRRAEWEAEKLAAAQELAKCIESFKSDVLSALDGRLHPFVAWPDFEDGREPEHSLYLPIRVPGCADVVVFFQRHDDGHWKPRDPIQYKVFIPRSCDGSVRYSEHDPFTTGDLDMALAGARRSSLKFAEMLDDLKAHEAQAAREEEAREAARAERGRQRQEREAAEDAERKALVDFLSGDPVAFHLLRAMAALMEEREVWQDKLDGAGEAMDSMSEAFERRARNMAERERDLERKADEERRRAEDAEDEAEQAKRKARGLHG